MSALSATPSLPDAPPEAGRAFLSRLNRPGPVLVAVSGGGDSMALLSALREAAETGGARREIAAATVDHGLRAGSADEARWVATACAETGIGHSILNWSGEKPSTAIQASARLARYRLLSEEAKRIGAVAVVTAHTLDDQMETVAMRGARAGDAADFGLAGMAEAMLFGRSTWILRPFLGLSRSILRRWLAQRGQQWIDDPSNEDHRFERARVRTGQAVAVSLDAIIAAQAARRRTARAVAAVFAEGITVAGDTVARLANPGEACGDSAKLAAIGTLIAVMGGGSHRPSGETAERIARFLADGRLSRMTAARAVIDRRSDGLYIYRERRAIPSADIAAGEAILWDRRYRIENTGDAAVAVEAAGAEEIERARNLAAFGGVPAGVARRALGAQPMLTRTGQIGRASLICETMPEGVEGSRHFALFDVFLPDFDLISANQCMETFGRLRYGLPPVDAL